MKGQLMLKHRIDSLIAKLADGQLLPRMKCKLLAEIRDELFNMNIHTTEITKELTKRGYVKEKIESAGKG